MNVSSYFFRTLAFGFLFLVACFSTLLAQSESDSTLFGNVYGAVRDDRTGKAVRFASVALLPAPCETAIEALRNTLPVKNATRRLQEPLSRFAIRLSTTREDGSFLIHSIPVAEEGSTFCLAAGHSDRGLLVIRRVRVLPGAVMALRAELFLPEDRESFSVLDSQQAALRYRDELTAEAIPFRGAGPPSFFKSLRDTVAAAFESTIFATREGLVGFTTANGHVIVENDHFVALPSRRALAAKDTREFEVDLRFNDRNAVMPVWDIGPWNIRDDYWNPRTIRERFTDLPQGMPEAQAAFLNNYNGGFDGGDTSSGPRTVRNPAGIDLADGTFRQDLALPDNSWIQVKFLWVQDYALAARGGATMTTSELSGPIRVAWSMITSKPDQANSFPFAIFGITSNNTLISEASVPPAQQTTSAWILVEASENTNTGVALANARAANTAVTATLRNLDGSPLNPPLSRSINLSAWGQQAMFVTEMFSTMPRDFVGMLSLEGITTPVQVPIHALALRTRNNTRNDVLLTTLPVAVGDAAPSSDPLVFAHLADGGGLSTEILLLNPLNIPLEGTVEFFAQDGSELRLTFNGEDRGRLDYRLPPKSGLQLRSSGATTNIRVGYAVVRPREGQATPAGSSVFTTSAGGVLLSEAGVPNARPTREFAIYVVENAAQQTGIAIANTFPAAAQMQLSLWTLDGATQVATLPLTLAAGNQRARFIRELFSTLPPNFEGILRVTSDTPVSALALRVTIPLSGTRDDTLLSTLPIVDLTRPLNDDFLVVPHFPFGGGIQTQLLFLNPSNDQTIAGTANFFFQNGKAAQIRF